MSSSRIKKLNCNISRRLSNRLFYVYVFVTVLIQILVVYLSIFCLSASFIICQLLRYYGQFVLFWRILFSLQHFFCFLPCYRLFHSTYYIKWTKTSKTYISSMAPKISEISEKLLSARTFETKMQNCCWL